MKKILVFALLFCILLSLPALEIKREEREQTQEFDSLPMLENFYKEREHASEKWDKVTVSLITVSKDDPIYSWFGHAAILVEDENGSDLTYDYGRFAFGPDFYVNFAMGRLWYNCCAAYARPQLREMRELNRTVTKTVLNLSREQKQAVVDFLNTNASEKYSTYLYHHYKDNCSTRLRDLINTITNGDFERWAKSQEGLTYRQETSRILHNNILWQWLLDFLQSGNIDREVTLWEDLFLPDELSSALQRYNSPIVGEQSYLTDFRFTDTRPSDFEEPQSYLNISFTIGVALALIALILKRDFPKAYSVFCFVLIFVLGLLGCLLFFMSFFTSHDVTWNNLNLLFINPALLVLSFFMFKHKKHSKVIKICFSVLVALICINIIGKFVFPSLFIQVNWPQIATVLPLYLALALF